MTIGKSIALYRLNDSPTWVVALVNTYAYLYLCLYNLHRPDLHPTVLECASAVVISDRRRPLSIYVQLSMYFLIYSNTSCLDHSAMSNARYVTIDD